MTSQINIRVGDDWLDMPQDAKMRYTITNNIFFDGDKQRERSFPMELPNTPTNNRVFSWLVEHGTENSANTKFNCGLYNNRTFVADGTLKVKQTQRGYSIYILGQWATLSDTFRDDKMRDVLWPTGLTAPVTMQDIAEGSYPDYPCWYPGMEMFKAAPQDAWVGIGDGLFAYFTGNYMSVSGPDQNTQAANAAFYFLYILDTLCDAYNIGRVTGLFRTDPELTQLLVHSIDIRNYDWEKTYFTPESIPDMTIMEFFESIETLFCCEFVMDADRMLSTRFLRDTAARIDYLDLTQKVAGPILRKWDEVPKDVELTWPKELEDLYPSLKLDTGSESYIYETGVENAAILLAQDASYSGKLAYVKCDNHWTCFKEYAGSFRWEIVEWNMQIQKPVPANTLAEVASYVSLPAASGNEGKSALVRNENWFYTSDGTTWYKAFYNAASISLGSDTRKITPKCFPIPMDLMKADYDGDPIGYKYEMRLPGFKGVDCRVDANSENTSKSPSEIPPVLSFKREIWDVDQTFWPGGIATVLSFPMCYASSDEFDPDLTDAYDYSLWFDGPKGIYETWWKQWAQVLSGAQEIDIMMNLTLTDIISLDLHRPVYINGMKCWIKEVALELPLASATKVTFMKTR